MALFGSSALVRATEPARELRTQYSDLSYVSIHIITSRLAHPHQPGHVPRHRAVSQALPRRDAATRPSLGAPPPLPFASERPEPPGPGPQQAAPVSMLEAYTGGASGMRTTEWWLAFEPHCWQSGVALHGLPHRCVSRSASHPTRSSSTSPAAPTVRQSLTGPGLMAGHAGRRDDASEPLGLEDVIELAHRRG